ncbi:MAG: PAS domain-containing protein [Mariprofundales bacterium]|nr:PAS domain-containing protein [Mariprofundales bacterium]
MKSRSVTGVEEEFVGHQFIISKTDINGVITYVNTTFCRISGYKPSELIGQPHNIVRHHDMPESAFADMWQTIQGGGEWHGIIKNRCKNGDHYWVVSKVMPERDEQGNIIGYIAIRRPLESEDTTVAEAEAAIAGGVEEGVV